MTPLFLLHGALGAPEDFSLLREQLDGAQAITFPFYGHAGIKSPDTLGIALFARQALDEMDKHHFEQADFFGYSMGGYVALWLARHHPDRVRRVFTLATKLDWRPETASRESAHLDPDMLREKAPRFIAQLEKRHGDWMTLLQQVNDMLRGLGDNPDLKPEDFQAIRQPVLIACGDRDRTATPEESLAAYRLIPEGQFFVLPGTPHPFERAPLSVLVPAMLRFFELPF